MYELRTAVAYTWLTWFFRGNHIRSVFGGGVDATTQRLVSDQPSHGSEGGPIAVTTDVAAATSGTDSNRQHTGGTRLTVVSQTRRPHGAETEMLDDGVDDDDL